MATKELSETEKAMALLRSSTLELAQEEEDFDEAIGLLAMTDFMDDAFMDEGRDYERHRSLPDSSRNRITQKQSKRITNKPCFWWTITMGAVLVGVNILIAFEHQKGSTKASVYPTPETGIIQFACPAHGGENLPENYDAVFEEDYTTVSETLNHNMTEYLHQFRNAKFDDWGKSYEEFKANLYDWKSSQMAPYLHNASSIYESACGVGLNLYMTLEILHEVKGIEGIVVYGNEYVNASTVQANEIYNQIPPFGVQKGTICTADSSDLSYVPADSFDLVFTGYISTLLDPLHFEKGDFDENWDLNLKVCHGRSKDFAKQKLAEMAQERQESWFGVWVAQMTRIVKPGAPVIIEGIALPLCDEPDDWGGVSKEWWNASILDNRYGWDADPSTLVYGTDLNDEGRYHIAMKRNTLHE